MDKFLILKEFVEFLKKRKKWWLMPIMAFLVLLGFMVFISQGSVVAPFIYTLF